MTNDKLYLVVRNHEEQYSIWRADHDMPAGWEAMGPARSRDACLDEIEQIWTDITPLSARLHVEHSI
jgi:MbtH protein